ncbi:hypothetical protein Tco_1069339 [Tanacetum coccineum]|uniref:Uncharacterized protein n=1 Tax=Tanacetum coccineum TaxID=301880 RepID=A0ABQ5HK68_9ASTR
MANVSKSISTPNEEFSDDTTLSVARKFLNEVKSTIVTLQRVVKQKMTLDIHNWSSSAHQKIHKIIKDEILLIVNQVDARVQNFKIQFLKEATKYVRDFKSLAKEADESLTKHKSLELEIERLLRAVVSHDIMSIVQSNSVVDTSNLQTGLKRTKERFENCIIKKENEYAKLWNDKKNQSDNVSKSVNQKKQKENVKKSKTLSSEDRLASSRPNKPRTCLKWLPTGRIFDLYRKITSSNNTKSKSDTSVCDNASASNPQEPTNKGFPSFSSFLGRFSKLQRQNSCIYPLAVFRVRLGMAYVHFSA